MASNKGQGQMSQQSVEDYWLRCIKIWYPKLHSQTYFLPLYFTRVHKGEIAVEQALLAQTPQDGPSQKSSTPKSRSQKRKRDAKSAAVQRKATPLLLPPTDSDDGSTSIIQESETEGKRTEGNDSNKHFRKADFVHQYNHQFSELHSGVVSPEFQQKEETNEGNEFNRPIKDTGFLCQHSQQFSNYGLGSTGSPQEGNIKEEYIYIFRNPDFVDQHSQFSEQYSGNHIAEIKQEENIFNSTEFFKDSDFAHQQSQFSEQCSGNDIVEIKQEVVEERSDGHTHSVFPFGQQLPDQNIKNKRVQSTEQCTRTVGAEFCQEEGNIYSKFVRNTNFYHQQSQYLSQQCDGNVPLSECNSGTVQLLEHYSGPGRDGFQVQETVYPQPVLSFNCLIALAIKNSKYGNISTTQIFDFILAHFPYFRTASLDWKNLVQGILWADNEFTKVGESDLSTEAKRESWWARKLCDVNTIEQEIAKWWEAEPDMLLRSIAHPEIFWALVEGKVGLPAQKDDENCPASASFILVKKELPTFTEQDEPLCSTCDHTSSLCERDSVNDSELCDEPSCSTRDHTRNACERDSVNDSELCDEPSCSTRDHTRNSCEKDSVNDSELCDEPSCSTHDHTRNSCERDSVNDSTLHSTSPQGNLLLQPEHYSDVHDDSAIERVLYCLRGLADNNQPKEVMMVVSQLQFGKYIRQPSYAAAAALLPRPSPLPEHLLQYHYDKGDFDVLIIHRQYGLFTLQIKSVGANFGQLKLTEQQEDDMVMRKIKVAAKQLSTAEDVLKHLTSDLMAINITKILVMPNISSDHLLRAMNRIPYEGEGLCQCLGVHSVDNAVKLCLLSDQLSDKQTPSDVNNVIEDLHVWWQQVVKASGPQPLITSTVYEHLVARFCGPATTVEVHCVTAPRLDLKIPEEAVSETDKRTARLVLFPQQVELLNRSPSRVFVTGPPGTGKTIVLILQAITWIRHGHYVHVVSTWDASRAITTIIEHQLQQETMGKTRTSSCVHRHQFNLTKDGEVDTAVRRLRSLSRGRQLCIIADDAVYDGSKSFTEFCDDLIVQVPGVYLWGASVFHEDRPLCLEEVKLTTPLRSPPVIVSEVMKSWEIKFNEVHNYTVSDIPVPTHGPEVIQFRHHDGCLGHKESRPSNCVECGHQVARVLTELNVGLTGDSICPPPLQYRDVLVLCTYYPTDDRVDSNGHVITTASGLVRGLRACHVPVRVVEEGDEAAIRDTALDVSHQVTVTSWGDIHGLERKVVVVQNEGLGSLERLFAMSRCTSQLVLIYR